MKKVSRFLSVASYVPSNVVKNDDLQEYMDTSDEWIQQRTGIQQRHWVDSTTSTSDLALEAAKEALKKAQVDPSEIDMILLATLSPDHEFPGTACFLQAKLDLPGIPAIDVRQQCSGFIYACSIADQFIRNGQYQKILVVGAEVHSKGLDKSTHGRDVAVLFGDGAGAAILAATDAQDKESAQIYSTHLHADGRFAKELWVQAPGLAYAGSRLTQEAIESGEHYPRMNGKAVFVHASKRMPEALMEAVSANGYEIEDVDLFILHQANLRINEMAAKQLKIPAEKVFNTIQNFGNTTAATIPIGLAEAERAGVLKPGMLVASAAFGSGFTWSSMLYRW